MNLPFFLFFNFSCAIAFSQDTLLFKVNSGGTSSKNSVHLAYSIGDVITSPVTTTLSVFPLAALPALVITGLPENIRHEIQVSVFPNPVAGVLSISSAEEKGKLTLFDAAGKKIMETNWPVELPMQNFASGEYYVVLISQRQAIQSYKIIKQ